MLAAGLEGIRQGLELAEPMEQNIHDMSEVERKKKGIQLLPQSLGEAIAIAQESKFLKDTLGEHIFHSLLENKKIEWAKYCAEITDYELKNTCLFYNSLSTSSAARLLAPASPIRFETSSQAILID